jgi:hypothetical protein
MALTAIKTYFTKMVSVSFSSETGNARGNLWALKESLLYGSGGIKGGPGAWEVMGSCDGSTYGMDGVDRWTDYNKIIASTTAAHSWIILRQPAMGLAPGYYQLLIDMKVTTALYANLVASFSAGFAGGTTIVRPTASDEVTWLNVWHTSTNQFLPYTVGVNCVKSTDGEVTRVFFSQGGGIEVGRWPPLALIFMEKVKNPVSWWPNPCLFSVATGYSQTMWAWFAGEVGGDPLRTRIGATPITARFTAEGTGISGIGPGGFYYGWIINKAPLQRPDFNGEWVVSPAGIISCSTVMRGRLGEFFDLWLAPQSMPLGEYIASTGGGERQFINLYNMIVPWDGTHLMLP